MKFSTIIAGIVACSAAAFANPIEKRDSCVSQWEAQQVVSKIISIFGHQAGANKTANALLADNFVEHSDSIHALEGAPVSPAS